MKIKNILLAVSCFFSAIFYVLFKQKKAEDEADRKKLEQLEQEKEAAKAELQTVVNAHNAGTKIRKEYEEDLQSISDGTVSSFTTGIDMLQKLSEKGKERNKSRSNTCN